MRVLDELPELDKVSIFREFVCLELFFRDVSVIREGEEVAGHVLHDTLAAQDTRVVVLKPPEKGELLLQLIRFERKGRFLLEAVVPNELSPRGHVSDAADVEVLEAVQECR